jgi:hypothetical protein
MALLFTILLLMWLLLMGMTVSHASTGTVDRLEVIAEGGKITVLLNGIVVNRAVDGNPKKGRPRIQYENP